MKKKLITILTICCMLFACLGIIGCGDSESGDGGTNTPPSHTHEFKNIKYDATDHWYECDCGEQSSSKDNHSGGTATCKSKAVCEHCGVEYGNYSEHTYSNELYSNSTIHYKKATCGCDIDTFSESHVDNGKGVCSVCNTIFVPTEGLKFEISNDQTFAKVVGYEGDNANVVIPNYYNDIPVTIIGESALYQNNTITSVLMPTTITTIEEKAFAGCVQLTSIEFNGENANYTTIDGSLYSKDKTILIQCAIGKTDTTFEMPSHVTSIGSYAFAYDSYSSLFDFKNATNIGKYAFKGCYFYSGVQLPTALTTINEYAFSEVEWLTEIKIPSTVKTIENYAFYKSSRLRKVTFADNSILETIGEYAFSGANLYDGINLPNSLITIGNYSFSGCKYISSVLIPSSVELIGYHAFNECESLKTVTFADNSNIKLIDFYAFAVCSKLETVNFGANSKLEELGERVFYACSSLKEITLPTTLTTIGASAFHFCQSLSEIYIPKSVAYMGVNAFYNCNWTIIYCQAESEPKEWNVAWNPSNCTVYWGC